MPFSVMSVYRTTRHRPGLAKKQFLLSDYREGLDRRDQTQAAMVTAQRTETQRLAEKDWNPSRRERATSVHGLRLQTKAPFGSLLLLVNVVQ